MMSPIKINKNNTSIAVAIAIAVALCAATPDARRLLQDDDGSTCIQTSTPKDFIRIWGLELGGDAATNVEDLDGLPCDGQWEDFSKDSAPYLQHAVYSSMPATLKEVMAELKVMTGDPNSSVFRCGPKGVKWYTVNDFRGCTLRDGETFNYKGKNYANTDGSHIESLAATVSYVCNGEARRRDIGVTYSAILEDKCV